VYLYWELLYYVCGLCLAEKKYHKKVDKNKIKPPENVVTREDFKPLQRICGAIFEILGERLKALLIPTAVAMIPKMAVAEPINIILSMWKAPFMFLNDIKIKIKNERKIGIIRNPPERKY
tara:strand:- start:284 stop:643 length:360 start_codon:yes stop_codon:yes gene_type:complete